MVLNIVKNWKLLFKDYYLNLRTFDVVYLTFLLIWVVEWGFFFEYVLNFWSSTRLIFPYRLSVLVVLCFLYWAYVWGVSIWRRTQYGRFTRGDRKLWAKSFASFWIIEIFTVAGIYICICWMSWGPIMFIPRYYWVPKKGFLVELTFFTYMAWTAYLMRFSLKWQLWKTQFFLTLVVILFIACLIWRDILTLYFRELVTIESGANWRYIKLTSILYSLSMEWWLEHYIGHWRRNVYSIYTPLNKTLKNICLGNVVNPFTEVVSMTEYERYNWVPYQFKSNWIEAMGFSYLDKSRFNPTHLYLIQDRFNILRESGKYVTNTSLFNDSFSQSGYFYPRRLGYLPKRLAMWYMLVVIKIWHHFMLFIWWFFYLMRLYIRKKSSYTLLSICYFNIYCCFLIGLLVYLYHVLPFVELYLKYRPMIQSIKHYKLVFYNSVKYVIMVFLGDEKFIVERGSRELLFSYFYKTVAFNSYSSLLHDTTFEGFNYFQVLKFENSIFTEFPSVRSIALLDSNENPLLCENFVYDYGSLFDIVYQGDFKKNYVEIVETFKNK